VFFLVLCTVAPTEAASIGIGWDPSNDPSVVGYKVHYGDQPRHYTKTVKVKGRFTSSVVIHNLEEGKAYFFAVTAYNAKGKESAYSAEISNINAPQGGSPNAPQSTSRSEGKEGSGPAGPRNKIPASRNVAKTPEGKILPSRVDRLEKTGAVTR
jgi:hypothetical protein